MPQHRSRTGISLLTALALSGLLSSIQTPDTAVAAPRVLSSPPTQKCEEYQGSFLYTTAQDMLSGLGVTVFPEDTLMAFPDPALGIGAQVTVCRAPLITIVDAGSAVTVRSWAKTVSELAEQQRLMLADKDEVKPARSTELTDGSRVVITRVAEAEVPVKVSLDFAIKYQDDPEMERGTQKVVQVGEKGLRVDTYLVRRENGKEVSRRRIKQETQKEPVAQLIKRGTKITVLDQGGASWYGGVPAMTAAHKTLPKGTRVRVVNVSNGKSVVVTIADRGPFVPGRVIDLSKDAFAEIAPIGAGVATVRVEKE